ncbi:nucleotidyltransferase family protein [Vibrio gallicus]|uniref:hypothetical protein n=1 Tax=Vibrio gallicus TaxID=190897 RepID=UPI0021C46529|nr:hypothetical protein [Vibrio gallicus]
MATTVNGAFNELMSNHVNLDAGQVKTARVSRNWLIEQLNELSDDNNDFPTLYKEVHMGFGSFARSTKKRELDDIDYLLCMNAKGVTYADYGDVVYMHVPETAAPFNNLTHPDSNLLNSARVINRFIKHLNDVPQYEKAEIKRNQEAATLQLQSYPWNFDIVPCFLTSVNEHGKSYYLIPDGQGHWKKTDPRIDKERTTRVNQLRDGHVLQVIRAMKYWNKRPTMASMGSYLLENMILDYYENHSATQWVDLEVKRLLAHIRDNIFNSVNDPKGIQGNINNLTPEQKNSIYLRASEDYDKAVEAVDNESSNPAYAISKWISVFGVNFPTYG